MSNDKPKYKALELALLFIAAVSFFIIFLVLILRVDLYEALRIFTSSRKDYFALAIGWDLGFMFFYGVAWYFLVRIISDKVSLKESVIIVIISWFGDMVIPAAFITGEIIRLVFLKRRYNINMSEAAATVVVHRLLSITAFVLFIMLGTSYLILNGYNIKVNVFLQIILFVILALSLAFLCFIIIIRAELFEKVVLKVFNFITKTLKRKYLEKYSEHLERSLNAFKSSMSLIKKKRINVILSFICLIIQWICGIMIPYTFFRSVNYPVSFWVLAMAYPMYGVIDNIPVGIPANAGILDAAMVSTFVLLGINKEVATAVTSLTRFVIVIFEAIFTGTITFIFGPRLLNLRLSKIIEFVKKQEDIRESY